MHRKLFVFICMCWLGTTECHSAQVRIADSFVTASHAGQVAEHQTRDAVFVDGDKYPCSAAGIQSAVTAAGTGGTVHAEGCVTPFVWSSTVTVGTPLNLWAPCAKVTWTVQVFAVTSDDVHLHGCGGGTLGQVNEASSATSAGQWVARGIAPSVDFIVVQKPGVRKTLAAARLSQFAMEGFYIDMNSLGDRAVYTTSCWDCKIENVTATNLNCPADSGGIYIEADLAGTTVLAESYFLFMRNVQALVFRSSNTTCHPFEFDSSNGEIAYGTFINLYAHGAAVPAGGGSDGIFVTTGATDVHQSFDQNVFINPKTSDPTADAGGIKLQAKGNFLAAANGRIFSITIVDPQPERIFSTPRSGIGIGCVNAAGVPDGTGCGFIHVIGNTPGGWKNNEDWQNLGTAYMSESTQFQVAQGPVEIKAGPISGNSGQFTRYQPTLTPNDANQTLFTTLWVVNTDNPPSPGHPHGFSGETAYVGPDVDMASGTHRGRFQNAFAFTCNGFGVSWVHNPFCLYTVGSAGNHMDSFLQIGGSSQPCPSGAAPSLAVLCYDSDENFLRLSNDNGGSFQVPQETSASATLRFTAIPAQSCQDQTLSMSGAISTASVSASPESGLGNTNLSWSAWISSSGAVNVRVCNPTGASITPSPVRWQVRVLQ